MTEAALVCFGQVLRPRPFSAPRIQMPAGILPHAVPPDEDLCGPAALYGLAALLFQLRYEGRVQDRNVSEDLPFGSRKVEADEFSAAACKRLGGREHRGPILPRRIAVGDRDDAVGKELLEATAVIGEPRLPNRLTVLEQSRHAGVVCRGATRGARGDEDQHCGSRCAGDPTTFERCFNRIHETSSRG